MQLSALALFPVEAERRMPFIMPHYQDEDAFRGDLKEHVIGELHQVCSPKPRSIKMVLFGVLLNAIKDKVQFSPKSGCQGF
jgi:hypothetical protein